MAARRRRAAGLAGVVLCAGVAMAACGSSSGSAPAGPLTLTAEDYFTADPAHSAVGSILDSCAKSAGVNIVQQSVANPQLMPKVLQQLSAHTLPDLLMLDNPDLQQIATTGALTPLDSVGVKLSGYYPSIVAAGSYQGKVYGLAPGVNSIALVYNKDMFAAAGITAPPSTWDELKADAAALTTPQHYGFAMSADNDGEGAWSFLPFFWSNGGDLKHLDSAQSVAALQFVTGLVHAGSMSKSVVTWAQSDVNEQFMAGKAAMMINGPWQLPVLAQNSALHYGVTQIPAPAEGTTVKVPLGGEVWTVPVTDQAHEQAAAKVLACMNDEANQLSYAKANSYVPSLESAAKQAEADNPLLTPFAGEVSTALSRTAEVGTDYPKIQTALETALASSITGSSSPQAALSTAQSAAN